MFYQTTPCSLASLAPSHYPCHDHRCPPSITLLRQKAIRIGCRYRKTLTLLGRVLSILQLLSQVRAIVTTLGNVSDIYRRTAELLVIARSTLPNKCAYFRMRHVCGADLMSCVDHKDGLAMPGIAKEHSSSVANINPGVTSIFFSRKSFLTVSCDFSHTMATLAVSPVRSARRLAAGVFTTASRSTSGCEIVISVALSAKCNGCHGRKSKDFHGEQIGGGICFIEMST